MEKCGGQYAVVVTELTNPGLSFTRSSIRIQKMSFEPHPLTLIIELAPK